MRDEATSLPSGGGVYGGVSMPSRCPCSLWLLVEAAAAGATSNKLAMTNSQNSAKSGSMVAVVDGDSETSQYDGYIAMNTHAITSRITQRD